MQNNHINRLHLVACNRGQENLKTINRSQANTQIRGFYCENSEQLDITSNLIEQHGYNNKVYCIELVGGHDLRIRTNNIDLHNGAGTGQI